VSQSAELREAARVLLRVADDLEQAEQTRRYLLAQADREPAGADERAFDRAAGGGQ
jgi:hypothetical protein